MLLGFPCFDEPEFKAIFALEITVDSHLSVISNMPIMEVIHDKETRKRTDRFEWTKEMSSYLGGHVQMTSVLRGEGEGVSQFLTLAGEVA